MMHPANILSERRTHPRSFRGVGDSLFTVTANTSGGNSPPPPPIDTSDPLVTLLLGAALGAGVVALIFTWK
jgi:hypothetical protein